MYPILDYEDKPNKTTFVTYQLVIFIAEMTLGTIHRIEYTINHS